MKSLGQALRKDFPILQRTINDHPLIYVDNAATTQKPQAMLDAVMQFYSKHNANIFRGVYTLGEEATEMYEKARSDIAAFIGADSCELMFTGGATEGLNFIASTWAAEHIQAGDEIVITELEHHANILPWQRCACERGAHIVHIPVHEDGTLCMDELDRYITPRTKLLSFAMVSNVFGTEQDVATLVKAARAVGAKVCIDAAQSVPRSPIDVHALDCDFLVFSGHKMLGPTGIGCLYIAKGIQNEVPPYKLGGGMVTEVRSGHYGLQPAPYAFEAGTPPIAQAIGLQAAVRYLQTVVDFPKLHTYEAELCRVLIDGLSAIKKVKVYGRLDHSAPRNIVSFNVEGKHPHDVAAFCDQYGICVRGGFHCAQPFAQAVGIGASVRASVYCYNTTEEVQKIISVIDRL